MTLLKKLTLATAIAGLLSSTAAVGALSEGTYYIKNKKFGEYLKANSSSLYQDLQIVKSTSDSRIKWKLIKKGDYFHIQNADTGQNLRPRSWDDLYDYDGGTAGELYTVPSSWTGDWTQWSFTAKGDYYIPKCKKTGGTMRPYSSSDQTIVQAPGSWSGNWVQWEFIPVDDSSSSADYPSDILDHLEYWKLTLPVDEDGNDSSGVSDVDDRNTDAYEVKDEDLIDYEYSPYFYVDSNNMVRFRAHCAGATTSGSKYPRCELRQRVGGGDNYWDMDDYQYMYVKGRVTKTPTEKPEVCVAQIHGPENEPMRVQYNKSYGGLYLIWNESNKDTDSDEIVSIGLNTDFEIKTTVENGSITCIIKNLSTGDSYSRTWSSNDDTGYFKTGCYTQSSIFLSQFKDGYDDESSSAYGEVAISQLELVENYNGSTRSTL